MNPVNLLPLYRRLIGSTLISGLLLAALLPLGLISIQGISFQLVWGAQTLFHLLAVGLVCQLIRVLAKQSGRVALLYLGGGFASLAISALVGALPIISRDALIYHLAVPKWWLAAGRVVELPWHEWSHFPLLISGAYAGFLQLGLERFTPLYHLSYLVLFAGLVMSFVHYKFQDAELSLWSGGIAVAMPLSVKLGSEPMADLAVAVYFGLTIALFTVWAELRGGVRALIPVGLALGLALSTKYNALLAAVVTVPLAVLFLKRWHYPLPVVGRAIGMIGLLGAAVYFPWPLKNGIYTGNPFYPFLASVFGGADELPFLGEVGPLRYRMEGYGEGFFDILLLPFRMLAFGRDDAPQHFDGVLSPVLILALCSLLHRRRGESLPPWIRFFGGLCTLYFVLSLFLFYALVRYQMPVMFVILVLTAAGISALGDLRGGVHQAKLYRGLFAFQLIWCGWYCVGLLTKTHAVEYFSSTQTPEDYLRRHLGEYRVAETVNAKLPADAVVYLLFTGNRYFYYDRAVRGAYFSAAPILTALKQHHSASAIAATFQSMGVTHFAIHSRRTLEALQTLEPTDRAVWSQFVQKHLRTIEETRGVGLYEFMR